MKLHLTAILLAASSSAAIAACPLGDDVGDEPRTANLLPAGGYDTPHTIGPRRSDIDVFCFLAIPGAQYSFRVEEDGVPALDVSLRAGDGRHILERHNTLGATSAIDIVWSNAAVGGFLYLDVRSFGETATGGYQLRMEVTPPADQDGDQLPDDWETGPWTNGQLSVDVDTGADSPSGTHDDFDGDGLSNFQELLLGTDPTSADLDLRIHDIDKDPQQSDLTWPAVQFGAYEISSFDMSDGATWTNAARWRVINQFTHTAPSGEVVTEDEDGTAPDFKVYRVRRLGIPPAP